MSAVEVRTRSELEQAIKAKAQEIVVLGDLAEKLHSVESVKTLSKPALVALGASLAAMPFTGGASGVVGVAALTATTGLSIAVITAIAFLGLALILSITDGYDDREFIAKAPGKGEARMRLRRRR